MKLWEDPRVVRGMQAQFETRRKRLDGGDESLGWKVGFGAPAMLQLLNISAPLVGFLTRNARVQSDRDPLSHIHGSSAESRNTMYGCSPTVRSNTRVNTNQ